METWTNVAANAAIFLGPMLAMLGAQILQERRELRKSSIPVRTRGRR